MTWPYGIARWLIVATLVAAGGGCWAPIHSPGIPASQLPESFRIPTRTLGPFLNYADLTVPPPKDYLLGPGDIVHVTVPELYDRAETTPLRVHVMASGEIYLPLVGAVRVGETNLLQAQGAINKAYANGFFKQPRASISLAERAMTNVVVLGQTNRPGIHALPKYENDVAHALAAAGGLTEDAATFIEIHRRTPVLIERGPRPERLPAAWGEERLPCLCPPQQHPLTAYQTTRIQRIPLRGPGVMQFRPEEVTLGPNDVVVVPSRRDEVFFVVGLLSTRQPVRFTVGSRERELGVGFILPRDREVDVVTAVTMAGYIDPIDSPTTVTVQRNQPGGNPLLIRVDLVKARYDRRETVLVKAGDIIYLNPDTSWWLRRTFDRVLPDLITIPYGKAILGR